MRTHGNQAVNTILECPYGSRAFVISCTLRLLVLSPNNLSPMHILSGLIWIQTV